MRFLAVPVGFGVGADDNKQPFRELTLAFPGGWVCHYLLELRMLTSDP